MYFGQLLAPERNHLVVLVDRKAACFKGGLDAGREGFNGSV